VVREHGPLPPGALADLARGLLTGSAAIHGAGIVHRDIAPGNVLIADDGHVRITDFGLARGAEDPTITDTGLVMGTASFVAPERRHGHDATPASDLYEIGATLFYAATGKAPSKDGRLPDGLPIRPLLEGLLQTDPADRPDSADSALSEVPPPREGSSTQLLTELHDPASATTRVIPQEEPESDWRDRWDGIVDGAKPVVRDAGGRLDGLVRRVRRRAETSDRAPSARMVLLVVIALLAAAFVLAMPSADPASPPAFDPQRAPADNARELSDWLGEVTGD
jgi:serine/threonine protein kinase